MQSSELKKKKVYLEQIKKTHNFSYPIDNQRIQGFFIVRREWKQSSPRLVLVSLGHMTPSSQLLKYIIHVCCKLPPERHGTIMELPLVGLLHMQI